MSTSKHKYVQSFSTCTFFKNLWVDCFRYKLSSVWSYIFLLSGLDKKPKEKQQQNKTTFPATRSQECLPTNHRQPTKLFLARFHVDFALLASLHCLLNWTVRVFVKEKPYLKLSKLIVNWKGS